VSTVTDAANVYGVNNNTKNVQLFEDNPDELNIVDWMPWAFSTAATYSYIWAYNKTTGGTGTALFRPLYNLDASGKITSITNGSNTTGVTNIALDASAPNKYIYTSNYDRVMEVKYSFDLTGAVNGVIQTRKVTVSEKWTYAKLQIAY
jgi:ribosomal protein L25 (general stress protein Ctc)